MHAQARATCIQPSLGLSICNDPSQAMESGNHTCRNNASPGQSLIIGNSSYAVCSRAWIACGSTVYTEVLSALSWFSLEIVELMSIADMLGFGHRNQGCSWGIWFGVLQECLLTGTFESYFLWMLADKGTAIRPPGIDLEGGPTEEPYSTHVAQCCDTIAAISHIVQYLSEGSALPQNVAKPPLCILFHAISCGNCAIPHKSMLIPQTMV